jgi:hypothetical protein
MLESKLKTIESKLKTIESKPKKLSALQARSTVYEFYVNSVGHNKDLQLM